jgi:hypothetical protein
MEDAWSWSPMSSKPADLLQLETLHDIVSMPHAISFSIPLSNTIRHELHLPSMATTTMDEGELPTPCNYTC